MSFKLTNVNDIDFVLISFFCFLLLYFSLGSMFFFIPVAQLKLIWPNVLDIVNGLNAMRYTRRNVSLLYSLVLLRFISE